MHRPILVSAASALLVACVGGATQTDTPGAPASESAATEAPTPEETDGQADGGRPTPVLGTGAMAEVVVDALNVRDAPGIDSAPAAPGLTGTLERGDRVYLAEGPVSASGYDWYFASEDPPPFWQPLGCMTGEDCDWPALGWVAIGLAGQRWLEAIDPCPAAPIDSLAIHGMEPLLRLHCLAGQSIEIEAVVSLSESSFGWDMPLFVAEPGWLGAQASPLVLIKPDGGGQAVLPVRYDPRFGDCSIGSDLTSCALRDLDGQTATLELVTDHPAALDCVDQAGERSPAITLRCRAQLVVVEVTR